MELRYNEPRYCEQTSPFPWPFIVSRFHCTCFSHYPVCFHAWMVNFVISLLLLSLHTNSASLEIKLKLLTRGVLFLFSSGMCLSVWFWRIRCRVVKYSQCRLCWHWLFDSRDPILRGKRMALSVFRPMQPRLWIPDSRVLNFLVSGTWILDSNRWGDSGFLVLNSRFQSSGFLIPQEKLSWILDSTSKNFPQLKSRLRYMGRALPKHRKALPYLFD